MVSFTSLALLSLAAIGSIAAPAVEKRSGTWHNHGSCLTDAQAKHVADQYGELIRAYSDELANEVLAKDFIDYSESVNTLINTCPQGSAAKPLPLLTPTFSNRAQFKKGQGQQPAINFNILNLEHNCQTITIRWETTNTAPIPSPRPVVGLILIEVVESGDDCEEPWLIHTVYSEFDSGAWLQNLQEAGICSVSQSGSPQLLVSGAAAVTASAAPASASAYAPASASTSTWAAASSAAAPSGSYAAQSSQAAASSWAAASSGASPSSYAAPSATASAYQS